MGGTFFSTMSGYDYLEIKNSVFEDINVKSRYPLIDGYLSIKLL